MQELEPGKYKVSDLLAAAGVDVEAVEDWSGWRIGGFGFKSLDEVLELTTGEVHVVRPDGMHFDGFILPDPERVEPPTEAGLSQTLTHDGELVPLHQYRDENDEQGAPASHPSEQGSKTPAPLG